jgi:hypothetical protein
MRFHPLVAAELETGTVQFAWMRGVTRRRWLAVEAGWMLLAAAVWGGVISAQVTWSGVSFGRPGRRGRPRRSTFRNPERTSDTGPRRRVADGAGQQNRTWTSGSSVTAASCPSPSAPGTWAHLLVTSRIQLSPILADSRSGS